MKFKLLKFVVLCAFVTAGCAMAFAGTGRDNTEKNEVLTDLERRMQKEISIDFRNTPIEDVLRIIAEQADVDIVKSPKVVGNVTATLTEVPLQEVLDNILISHGYDYVAGRNMIRIAPIDEITEKDERLVSKVYRISYADVTEVEKSLKKFISGRGSLSASRGTSNIIVTDTESKIKAIDAFIVEIDRITPQVLVEVRIYDITSQDKLDLGIEWELGQNTTYNGAVGNNPTGGERFPFATGGFFGNTGKTGSGTIGALRMGLLNGNIDIDVLIRAEQEISNAKLLANPRILVLDNEHALFDIVREIPYTEQSSTSAGGEMTSTKFKEVGVKLEVTPHVTRDGMVRLHIIPEFGVVVSTGVGGVPTVDTRKVNTIALVKDGQTVVLGGMRKKAVAKQLNKIPLLGDLPLIGGLFRFEGEDTTITELVVFITPRIITTPVLSPAEAQHYEATKFEGPGLNYTRAEGKKQR